MSFKLIPGLPGLRTVRTVLLAGTAAAAVLIGTGVAHAATPSPPASSTSQSPETTGGPDTDTVQSGDQTGSDTAEKTTGPDTDNVQSGDRLGHRQCPVRGPDRRRHRQLIDPATETALAQKPEAPSGLDNLP